VPVHFHGSESTAVQAKTMTFFASREAMIEDSGQILGSDSFALISDAEAQR
jgi:hypothetical protein